MFTCSWCGQSCDGSLMRMDPRYSRVRNMITAPEVPRTEDGGIALCHFCQRDVYFAGGYLAMIVRVLEKLARKEYMRRHKPGQRRIFARRVRQHEARMKTKGSFVSAGSEN